MTFKKGDRVAHPMRINEIFTVEATSGTSLWLKDSHGGLATYEDSSLWYTAPKPFFEVGKKYRHLGGEYTWRVDHVGDTKGTAWAVMYDIEDPGDVAYRTAEVFHNYVEVI